MKNKVPLTQHISNMHDTTWRDNETINWTESNGKGCITLSDRHDNTTDSVQITSVNEKCATTSVHQGDEMLHTSHSGVRKLHHSMKPQKKVDNVTFNICTETVQNDTGANRVVTNNHNMLHNFETIDAFPIGGIK